jgi:hypothetical protein
MQILNKFIFLSLFLNFISNASLLEETVNFALCMKPGLLKGFIIPYVVAKISYLKFRNQWRLEIRENNKNHNITEHIYLQFLKKLNEIDSFVCRSNQSGCQKSRYLIRLIDINLKENISDLEFLKTNIEYHLESK